MLGSRLRYQITGFLFLLFTMAIIIIGYFNITLLSDLLRRSTQYQTKNNCDQLHDYFDTIIAEDAVTLSSSISADEKFKKFLLMAETNNNLSNLRLYNNKGILVYSLMAQEDIKKNDSVYLNKSYYDRLPQEVYWSINRNGDAIPVQSYGMWDNRQIHHDFYYPIFRNDKIIGFLQISMNLERSSRILAFFLLSNVALIFVFIITAFIAIYIWSEYAINRPIRNLVLAQERLGHGDFDTQVYLDMPSNNELKDIAISFNVMTNQLKIYQQSLMHQSIELKQINDQYRRLNETLEQEVENKTVELKEFFSLITHDLKIPLAAIKGYIALLKKEKTGPLNDKQKLFVKSIENSTVSLLNMVKNMLDSVKYEAGKVDYYMEEFSLFELIKEVEEQLLPVINDKNIRFSSYISKKCGNVYADRLKILQVFSNILSNAINYTSSYGEIRLVAGEKGDFIEVTISDNGSGIPPDHLSKIFEKFQQIPGKESPSTSLGLGLYIVKEIIEGHEMGMKVWAESEEEKGSTFYFTLRKSDYGAVSRGQ